MRPIAYLLLLTLSSSAQVPLEHANIMDSVGLSGYDPVSYFEGPPTAGSEALGHEHDGVRYLFTSESNREAFKADPNKYLPEYGGWCAYAMLDGDKVEVDPKTFKFIDGKLYLFYNGFWGDTLKRWNKKLSKTTEASLVGQADEAWQKILSN